MEERASATPVEPEPAAPAPAPGLAPEVLVDPSAGPDRASLPALAAGRIPQDRPAGSSGTGEPGYRVAPGYELAPVERIFCELVEIDSPSFHEHEMAKEVRNRLGALGFVVTEDTTSGRKGACMNGPVFDAEEVVW